MDYIGFSALRRFPGIILRLTGTASGDECSQSNQKLQGLPCCVLATHIRVLGTRKFKKTGPQILLIPYLLCLAGSPVRESSFPKWHACFFEYAKEDYSHLYSLAEGFNTSSLPDVPQISYINYILFLDLSPDLESSFTKGHTFSSVSRGE